MGSRSTPWRTSCSWLHFGVILGPLWGRFGVASPQTPLSDPIGGSTPFRVSFWGHLGPFWGHFGVVFPLDPIAGSILNWGPILGPFGGHFGVVFPLGLIGGLHPHCDPILG